MPVTPEDFANMYLNLKVNCLQPALSDWGLGPIVNTYQQTIGVTRYRLGLNEYRQRIRQNLRKFLNQQSEKPDSGIVRLEKNRWAVTGVDYDPIPLITERSIARSMGAKASPQEFINTARIASLYMAMPGGEKALLGCSDLVTFADWYYGMDCNGFAGNYLRYLTGGSSDLPSTYCSSLANGPKRKNGKEVATRDFVYFNHNPDHIAVVGTIYSQNDAELECNLSEARSFELGGVQTNRWRIQKKASGWSMRQLSGGGSERGATWIARNKDMP